MARIATERDDGEDPETVTRTGLARTGPVLVGPALAGPRARALLVGHYSFQLPDLAGTRRAMRDPDASDDEER